MSEGHEIHGADRKVFALAGNAIFTLVSSKTGQRFTFKITTPPNGSDIRFVGLLSGPDNTSDYRYLGIVGSDGQFHLTKKSRAGWDAASVKAIAWFLTHSESTLVEFWHEGRCGRCGRRLTVPESIATGLGPVCASRGVA
jgi:hypothetical protein